jgi:hypothetical protein
MGIEGYMWDKSHFHTDFLVSSPLPSLVTIRFNWFLFELLK